MKSKLNCILLVDDSYEDNFYHQRSIHKLDCTHQVFIAQNGKEALDFLQTSENGKYPSPELIFMDINMPVMDGWEFLKAYEKLDEDQKGEVIIVMLTTSINPDDQEKAKAFQSVKDYINKPLTVELLQEILDKYFP